PDESANASSRSLRSRFCVCRPLRGLNCYLVASILGLTPQAGVPSRASRLGWKTLCYRRLRPLAVARLAGFSLNYGFDPGAYAPGRGPQPSISAGVEDFMLSPAPPARRRPLRGLLS